MKPKSFFVLALGFTLLMGGTTPSPLQRADVQRDLAALTKRGFTYRMLENDLIELTDPLSGEKHLKSLREQSEEAIRSWAAARGIPILEINPATIDTTQFAGWYVRWGQLPVSNGFGHPLILDSNHHVSAVQVWGLDLGNDEVWKISGGRRQRGRHAIPHHRPVRCWRVSSLSCTSVSACY